MDQVNWSPQPLTTIPAAYNNINMAVPNKVLKMALETVHYIVLNLFYCL